MQRIDAVRDWLAGAHDVPSESLEFRVAYARAGRKLALAGKQPLLALDPGVAQVKPHWTVLDGARWLLTCRALSGLAADRRNSFLHDLFSAGELGEQVSLLRTLAALPEAERFVDTAVEACRTNSVAVFEAIACENAYPSACFADLAFNQMVIKALFLELSIRRIEGLAARITPELQRMAQGLVSERTAAGRSIPPDIDLIVPPARQA